MTKFKFNYMLSAYLNVYARALHHRYGFFYILYASENNIYFIVKGQETI